MSGEQLHRMHWIGTKADILNCRVRKLIGSKIEKRQASQNRVSHRRIDCPEGYRVPLSDMHPAVTFTQANDKSHHIHRLQTFDI